MEPNAHFLVISDLLKNTHTAVSGSFLLIAIWLMVRTIRGYWKNLPFKNLDTLLSYGFIIALYLQLIFGLILFASPAPTDNYSNMDGALKMASRRFWPVEHIVFMLFALFIANIGLIFSNQAKESKEKFRKILIYYSIAIAMIAVSLTMIRLL
jgi:hypothetical protein